MHPAFLDNMSWEMAEVYGAITDQILINLARYFPFYEYVDDLPTSAFTYQAQMLAQMGQVNKQTIQIIRNGLSDADLALQGVLEQAVIDAVKTAEPELLEAVKKGVFAMPTTPVVAPNQMRAFQLYYEQAADKLNLVNTVMLESTQSAYQQAVSDVVAEIELADRLNRTQIALDSATGEIVTGVSSWNQAIKHATDRLKDGGITGFIDHAGRQWSAEAYVAMDMRTTVFNTGRAATWETNQNFGNDLYVVSYHNGARPLCYPWQNKVISSMDSSRKVVDLDGNEIQVIPQSQTSYGQAAGLFGINCKHYPTPFIPGVSVIEGQPQDPEANAKTYAESQQQRGLERKLREEKRDLQMLKAQGASEEDIAKQQAKCRQTSADIDEFCKSTGRARHRDREAVYTKREFPDADRYDVSQFEKDQKKLIDDYYKSGGEQQRYTFGEMQPNEPLVPNMQLAPQATGTPNQAVMTYGKAFDYSGNRKAQKAQFADAKATLTKAPENTRKVWEKVAPNFQEPSVGTVNGSQFDSYYNRVRLKTYKEAFEESSYQRKNVVFFHEYGHNIDNLLAGGGYDKWYSVNYKNGAFGKMIEQECEEAVKQFHAQKQMTEAITDKKVGNEFRKWVKDTYDMYQRGDISDMFERHLYNTYGIQYPFGVGHGGSYHSDPNNTPIEAFAEMFSATVTGNDSLPVIKQFFPKSYKIFEEMLGSVIP